MDLWNEGGVWFDNRNFLGLSGIVDKLGKLHLVCLADDREHLEHIVQGSRSPYGVNVHTITLRNKAVGIPTILLSTFDGVDYLRIFCPLENIGVREFWVKVADVPDPSGPLPPPTYPADTPKPSWMPKMVMACLSLHVQLPHYTDEQLTNFANKISRAGLDYVRVMMCWDDPEWQTHITTISPFIWKNGKADLDNPNFAFDASLLRLKDILKPYHIKVLFDLYDNCDAAHSPWNLNINGVNGVYDYGPVALMYAKQWVDRIMNILPASEGHRIGIGNEMQIDDDENWIRNFVLPLGEYIKDKGANLPISFSGYTATGHHMNGALSPDLSSKFGIRDSCLQIHSLGFEEQFTQLNPLVWPFSTIWPIKEQLSDVRSYAYSDDGFYRVDDPRRRGRCTNSGTRCQANNTERIKIVKAFWEELKENRDGTPARLDHIEFLPSEICGIESPDLIEADGLEIYNRIAMELWNFDIRRR